MEQIYYRDFSREEIMEFEKYLDRVLKNLERRNES
jgi:hypothetical protein